MATHSSTLAWKIPWMEEPGRLLLPFWPYDTLETAVGLSGNEDNALSRFGIGFRMAELREMGEEPFDHPAVLEGIVGHPEVKMLYV